MILDGMSQVHRSGDYLPLRTIVKRLHQSKRLCLRDGPTRGQRACIADQIDLLRSAQAEAISGWASFVRSPR